MRIGLARVRGATPALGATYAGPRRHALGLGHAQGHEEQHALEERTLAGYFRTLVDLPIASTGETLRTRPAIVSRHENFNRAFGYYASLGVSLGDLHTGNGESTVRLSFDNFDRAADALAFGLLKSGVKKGDRVAVLLPNNTAYALLQMTLARIGAILVTVNPAYRVHELKQALQLVTASHLVVVPQIAQSAWLKDIEREIITNPLASSNSGNALLSDHLPDLKNIFVVNNAASEQAFKVATQNLPAVVDFRDIFQWTSSYLERSQLSKVEQSLHHDDVVNLQFTSGTTSLPKAVSLTHHNLLNNAIHIGSRMRVTPNDILVNAPPLFHCFGLVLGNLAFWVHGGCVVYPSERFDPDATLQACHEEKATALHGVPTMFIKCIETLEKNRAEGKVYDLSSMRTGIAAGSPVPIEVMKRVTDPSLLNIPELTIAFGMTETSPVTFQSDVTTPLTERCETVGQILPHLEAKIVDQDSLATLPFGERGELLVAGYPVMKGYWGDTTKTDEAILCDAEGLRWMRTGDMGVLDEKGYLRIVGRVKDIIIRGGENVSPVQVEDVVLSMPGVSNACVVGAPHPVYGEVVAAIVQRKDNGVRSPSANEVKAHVKKGLHFANVPEHVWFVGDDIVSPDGVKTGVVHEIPLTASGKMRKNVVKDWVAGWVKI
ncbi:hypothetical protein BC830DRAFT_1122828 [Chytriomyces sp. MP71]|nr:hypothetical protein BC830DRAFT_1122828 [Chytriomyces sp. MP71]